MSANNLFKDSNGNRYSEDIPMLEDSYMDGTFRVLLGIVGEDHEAQALGIKVAFFPADEKYWPEISKIIVPLASFRRFKDLLIQMEAVLEAEGRLEHGLDQGQLN
jgi:hypothetical protein